MKNLLIFFILIVINGCTTVKVSNITIDELPVSEVDNIDSMIVEPPYEINGKWFYPKNYTSYSQIGIASQISSLEAGSRTTNGEKYHPDILSGAHASLAIPSMISVTNLSNGYTVNVRINQRGGYSKINTIELSPAVFELLEIKLNVALVEINLINQNETFVLKEAKTYEEEKKVKKAPISLIYIENNEVNEEEFINNDKSRLTINNNVLIKEALKGKLYLNITKFSFKKSAESFRNGFKSDLKIDIIETTENEQKYYNVVIGPFKDIDSLYSLQKNDIFSSYEDLSLLII